jgi:DNA sulfur modification protein DndD
MVINSIKITNFRCYYGTSSLSFNANGKITLIYGDSGYGKSSLLQFFRWMFYNDYDFGKSDDRPLFNIPAYQEHKLGETIEVSGQIDFEHLGVSYRLNRAIFYSVAFKMGNASVEKTDYVLQVKGSDDGYHPFVGNVANKINTILPKELSKYFLLDGERSRDIVLDSNELRKAIYSLFEIDVYNEALSHIGVRSSKSSVLGHYASQMALNTSSSRGKLSLADLQDTVQDLYDKIEKIKEKYNAANNLIKQLSTRSEEILKTLGEAASKGNLNELIKIKKQKIKDNDKKIDEYRHKIGDFFYSTYPYLILAQRTSESTSLLRRKNTEYANKYQNIFDNLKKELLEEIIQKNLCVCGRELDKTAREHISGVLSTMPPDSYIYYFAQYISNAKKHIKAADADTFTYEKLTSEIASLEEENANLEGEIQDEINELNRLNSVKDIVAELEQIKSKIKQLEQEKDRYWREISQDEKMYEIAHRKLDEEMNNTKISAKYKADLDFFEQIALLIKDEKDKREERVKEILNNCVKDIFKKLTTQTELDVDKIQFVNDDFSLRTTYLTGGQLAVDVYSYVIGIIKALQECKMDNNENPIIIDAPFAFTGNTQSEHIFKTLPSVSKQTILLTLDLNKIKSLLVESNLYDFYVIKNDTQEKATIVPGDINDFNS